MIVSSTSETTPKRVDGSTTNTGAWTGREPPAASVTVCQPGSRSSGTRVSTTPPRSACTRCVAPPAVTVTSTSSTATLVKLRQPRTPS